MCILVAGVISAALAASSSNTAAQTEADSAFGPRVPESGTRIVAQPVLRSADAIRQMAGAKPMRPVARGHIINRPTIPLTEYNGLKLQVGLHPAAQSSASAPPNPESPSAMTTPIVRGVNFNAAVEGENAQDWVPSDSIIAVGKDRVVEVTNSSIDIYAKVTSGTPTHIASFSEDALTGSTDQLGDARVLYDWLWNRWIISVADFSNSIGNGTIAYLCVSTTSDPNGSYYVYPISLAAPVGGFYDFPQMGIDQDALLFTANIFDSNGVFVGPEVYAVPKAYVYNPLGFSVPAFAADASVGTIAPPIVLAADNNYNDFFIAAPVALGQSNILKFTMTRAGRKSPTFAGPVNISVPSYDTPPPNAKQTCSSSVNDLDAIDGRFQNASIQNRGLLWNTHTVTVAGLPTPAWYEIIPSSNSLAQSGTFKKSATSYDFNPSIASAGGNAAVVNWSATDPGNGKNSMILIGGRKATDTSNVMRVNSTPLISTTACMTQNSDESNSFQRWGDYSTVSLDYNVSGSTPACPSGLCPNGYYWIVNQWTQGTTPSNNWATRIARVSN
jgi:hypothetical protein